MTRGRVTAGVSGLIIVLGLILLVETVAAGGGTTGYLLGALFVLAGAGRLYLSLR